jgi:hypothetical protein
VKRKSLLAGAFLILAFPPGPLILTGQESSATKDIFLGEKGCPLVSTFPVIGSAIGLKNVGQKTIKSFTLACFQQHGKKRIVGNVFNEEDDTIPPGKSTGDYGFDATPPNICRASKRRIGVYEVKFSDGTSWATEARR